MAATSTEGSNRSVTDLLVVMLVGFPTLRRRHRQGLFERCGLRTIEASDLENACDVLQRLVPDAIVLDTHNSELQVLSSELFRLLAICARRHETPGPKVLVLSSMGLSRELRYVYTAAGATVLPLRSQTLRLLVRIVREECGLAGDCCSGSVKEDEPSWVL